MNIAILGAGPAALIAGYACERNGHEPVFFARHEKSEVQPGMYLMRPLPGLSSPVPDASISYERRGTPQTYAAKVYGSPSAPVSWEHVDWGADRPLWWLSSVYDRLWDRYIGNISAFELDSESAAGVANDYPFVISTIPAPAICALPGVCHFAHRRIELVRVAAEKHREDAELIGPLEQNVMLYNGLNEFEWFRYTRISGIDTWEFPHGKLAPTEDMTGAETFAGSKPVDSTCDCHPKIARVGRWAQWERGILNHHTFERTQGLLASAGLGKEDN